MKHFKRTQLYLIVLLAAVLIFSLFLLRSYFHYKETSQYFYRSTVSDMISSSIKINEVAQKDQQEYTVQELNMIEQAQSNLILKYQDLFLLFQNKPFINPTELEFLNFASIYKNANINDWNSPAAAAQKVKLDPDSVENLNRLIEFNGELYSFYLELKANQDTELSEKNTQLFMKKMGEIKS